MMDDKLYEPYMPRVDRPLILGAIFERARSTAVAAVSDTGRRHLVIVTPGRLLMLQPCPPPGSLPPQQVHAIERMLPPHPRRNVAVIGYTDLTALQGDITKAIPFIGMLLGIVYVGHAVWIFEGHQSALAHGAREADVMIVDNGMLPYLEPDWYEVAVRAMRKPEVYVHDRAAFKLSPVGRQTAAAATA